VLTFLRKALPFLTVALIALAIYDGWIFYSRRRSADETQRAKVEREAKDARRAVDLMGGGELRILNFYASPGTIRAGDHANVCYGVTGATSVRMEPPVEELRPAVARCIQVSPSATTQYKLFAQDTGGHTITQEFVLKVVP
jgi:hypothetical protein